MEAQLYDLMQRIRQQPIKYLGKPSVYRLTFFLDGYRLFRNICGDKVDADKNNQFRSGFQDYIQDKYKITLTVKAESIIGFFSGGDKQGFYEYFKLIDTFIQEKYQGVDIIQNHSVEKSPKSEIPKESDACDTDFLHLLSDIYKLPNIFIGKASLECLYYLIQGNLTCLSITKNTKEEFNHAFELFLQNKYKISTNKNWEEIISFFSADEKEALDNFFLLITESLNLRGIPFELPERSPVYRP